MYDLLYQVGVATTTNTPTWISNLDFSGITDTANSLAGAVAPAIVAILGVVISIKLLKKFGNKIG